MFLMGCSPVKEPLVSPPALPQPSFKIDIPSYSLTSRLWEDIKQKWAVDKKGTVEELMREVDRGYKVYLYESLYQERNRPNVIEPQEVLDFAYGREDYYPLLAKHGFPVPFAMDDFNDSTSEDEHWKTLVSNEVASIKQQYESSKEAALKDSDPYKIELARRIHLYLQGFVKARKSDCASEMVDWKALQNTCGATSTLLRIGISGRSSTRWEWN